MFSKILPGGAAEQAGKLTEGEPCLRPGPRGWGGSCPTALLRVWGVTPGSVTRAQASLAVLGLDSASLGHVALIRGGV